MNLLKQYSLALILMLSAALACAQTTTRFDSQDAVQDWIKTYYQHPQLRQFLEVIQAASDQGLLAQEYRWNSLIGFVAGVVGKNPELAAPLADLVQPCHPPSGSRCWLGWYTPTTPRAVPRC